MRNIYTGRNVVFSLAAIGGLLLTGCGDGDSQDATGPADLDQPNAATDFAARDWCVEHGVPESQCGQCDAKLAAEFKKNGDWCEEHNRPESQCFICRPQAAAKFAAVYEAKYGEAPPKPSE